MSQSSILISINDQFLSNFESLSLTQKIHEHHEFEIHIDYDEIEENGSHTIERSKDWLGKAVVITIDEKEFLGVATHVSLVHKNGFHGILVVKGYSKTIMLETGAHLQSWTQKSLSNIVGELINDYPEHTVVQPEENPVLAYEAQYKESHFEVLKRLAKQYNEWFFYDGLTLHFGKPELEDPIKIAYGEGISEISIGMNVVNHTASSYNYNSFNDELVLSQTTNQVEGLSELGNHAFQTSQEVYGFTPNSFHSFEVEDKSQLDQALIKNQAAASAALNTVQGKSTDKRLGIGVVINLESARYDNKSFDEKRYGSYLITSITHSATGHGAYTNSFEAIPAGVTVLPTPKVKLPVAQPQIATVVSNEDPDQKGRVQVRFLWQSAGMQSAWIEVMTPDAGSSEHHAQNRGHVFVPEVNDQVMVGFKYNDPNRPFVMGSLFNGTTGSGGQDQNNFKTIVSKSGHVIEFNDTPNEERITVRDRNNNMVVIDTANDSIEVTANENMTFAAKNIELNAENIRLNAEENINLAAQSGIEALSQGTISLQSDQDTSLLSSAAIAIEASTNATITSQNTIVEGQTTAELNSAQTKISGSAMTEVSGGVIKLN
ncbi:type VI secretion system Vgr family protein [Aquimarina sp. 2-A2]|uniref:type VI secretion system Vgr family protein n=1 Tax=Aquimarina sp. 2-A2 TaxID=3382644 RepID=UPI00387F232C